MKLFILSILIASSSFASRVKGVIHLETPKTQFKTENQYVELYSGDYSILAHKDTLIRFLKEYVVYLDDKKDAHYIESKIEGIVTKYKLNGTALNSISSWSHDYESKRTGINPLCYFTRLLLNQKAYLKYNEEFQEAVNFRLLGRPLASKNGFKLWDKKGKLICKVKNCP